MKDLTLNELKRLSVFYNLHTKIKGIANMNKDELIRELNKHIFTDGNKFFVKQDKYQLSQAITPKPRAKTTPKQKPEEQKEENETFYSNRTYKRECYDKDFYNTLEQVSNAKQNTTLRFKNKELRQKFVVLQKTSDTTDFYPTPSHALDVIIKDMEDWGFNKFNVVEPSCGIGMIIKKLIDANNQNIFDVGEITGIEYNKIMYDLVKKEINPKCANIINADFLEIKKIPENTNCIIMNPPFTNGGDKKYYLNHIIHAYILLRQTKKTKYTRDKLLYFICPLLKEANNKGYNVVIPISKPKIKDLENIWGKNHWIIEDMKENNGIDLHDLEHIGTIENFSKFNLKAYDYKEEKIIVNKMNIKAGIYRLFF